MGNSPLKERTAHTIKWNTVDRLASQVLYAITGVVLANVLTKEDFGLVGALLVFQAFAILFVDSGFGAALLQKKSPDRDDYSTVFWFNVAISIVVYLILWMAAPLIADIFQNDARLIPMSRVMFLSFIFSGLGIVQTNRLMKRMDVRQIAFSNLAALIISGALGITLALTGYGAWALVWQAVTSALIKTLWLWAVCKWWPALRFSIRALKSIVPVGMGVFTSSMLNTIFQNIYSFIIGAFYNLSFLGIYTQADKWSKMPTASLSQIFTSSFVPLLSRFQDNADDFNRYVSKVNRFTAFLMIPVMGWLIVSAQDIFHTLFGTKWDDAILLFQLLVLRGIFIVMTSLYGNYLLSKGKARLLVTVEVLKDAFTIGALLITIPMGTLEALVWGQTAASALVWMIVLIITARNLRMSILRFLKDIAPYPLLTIGCMGVAIIATGWNPQPWLSLAIKLLSGFSLYIGILLLFGATTIRESLTYLSGKHIN